jgi:hypothetical protein
MSFLDHALDGRFPTDAKGRVLFIPIRRRLGYVVESKAEERKIRSFLKMYLIASSAIQLFGMNASILLGILQANLWPTDWIQYRRTHLVAGAFALFAIIFAIQIPLYWIPYALLWKSYKEALTTFTSGLAEVSFAPGEEPKVLNRPRRAILFLAIAAVLLVISLAAIMVWLTHQK